MVYVVQDILQEFMNAFGAALLVRIADDLGGFAFSMPIKPIGEGRYFLRRRLDGELCLFGVVHVAGWPAAHRLNLAQHARRERAELGGFHARIMVVTYEKEKPFVIKLLIFLHKS
jgi:hypothetical protein